MWGEVLGLALLVSLNPVLLGFILLVISRPRPVQNLLVFWVGCLIVNAPAFLVPLMVLHLVPTFTSVARDVATPDPGSTVQPLQLGTGVLALLIGALMAVRRWVRQRAKEPAPVRAGGDTSVLVLDSNTPTADSRPQGRVRGVVAHVRSAIRRLLHRGHDAWENGALWVALMFGMAYLPPPPLVLLVDTIIVGSGAAIGTQVIAVIAFVFAMLAVFEIVLISYLVAPARTQAILRPVHDWALVHRQHVLIALFLLVGVWQVITGLGIV
jgi:Sap, sulfolipid-1-addressing protein